MSDTKPIKPALSPDEWTVVNGRSAWLLLDGNAVQVWANNGISISPNSPMGGAHFNERRAATAALLLYGTPNGFTHEELTTLEYVCRDTDRDSSEICFRAIAKIAALLPPLLLPSPPVIE